MGGEPTLRDDLPELIGHAKETGFRDIILETNGTNLHQEQFIDELIENGLNMLSVPLEGPNAELHDKLLGLEGAFSKLIEGLKILQDKDVQVTIQTVVMKPNYKLLPETAEKMEQFSNTIIFSGLQPQGKAKKNYRELAVRFEKAQPYIMKAKEVVEEMPLTEFRVSDIPICYLGKEHRGIADTPENNQFLDEENQVNELELRKKKKTQPSACKKCRFNKVCDGVWKKYLDEFGDEGIQPIRE